VTYDIACQFIKKIGERFTRHSPELVEMITNAIMALPKFHSHGHKEDCQYQYGLPYIPGAGNLGGETIETSWSVLNKLAFLREAGPGMRKDALNEHMGDSNWLITSRSGTSFPL
jgi:hypothetical protein